jgi:hypothetical protein
MNDKKDDVMLCDVVLLHVLQYEFAPHHYLAVTNCQLLTVIQQLVPQPPETESSNQPAPLPIPEHFLARSLSGGYAQTLFRVRCCDSFAGA